MKKLFKELIFYSLPFLGLILILFFINIFKKDFMYGHYLHSTYKDSYNWIYDFTNRLIRVALCGILRECLVISSVHLPKLLGVLIFRICIATLPTNQWATPLTKSSRSSREKAWREIYQQIHPATQPCGHPIHQPPSQSVIQSQLVCADIQSFSHSVIQLL